MVKEIRSAEEIAEDQPRSRKMLTEAEAAELFRVSRATLRFWRGRGRGPPLLQNWRGRKAGEDQISQGGRRRLPSRRAGGNA